MSEYVFDFYKFEEPDLSTGLREGIVRCRDCSKTLDDITGTRLLCKHFAMEGDKSVLYPVVPEDGFCAWGKQRKRACQIAGKEATARADAETIKDTARAAREQTMALGA